MIQACNAFCLNKHSFREKLHARKAMELFVVNASFVMTYESLPLEYTCDTLRCHCDAGKRSSLL